MAIAAREIERVRFLTPMVEDLGDVIDPLSALGDV